MRRPAQPAWLTAGACLLAALVAVGCGSLSEARKVDYRNTRTLPPLEVPPDLSSLPDQKSPEAEAAARAATYSGYAGEQRGQAPAAQNVLPRFPGVRLAREGQTRYVVVDAEPAAVWNEVRAFLTESGLSIAAENPATGSIETHWEEKHELVGAREMNAVRRWLQSLFSTGMRDKYRLRLERGVAPGTTEIYISHQGMEEVAREDPGEPQAGWRPRASDPHLEAEMLHRLVVHLGGERAPEPAVARAKAAPAPAPAPATPPGARLIRNGNGAPLLTLEDSLDRAWRRVGLSLDRIGFTVEDRDRSKGIYYVRYIDPDAPQRQRGFFARMWGGNEPAPTNQYQVHVKPTENGTNVEVLDGDGDPEASKTGERILSLLYEQLK